MDDQPYPARAQRERHRGCDPLLHRHVRRRAGQAPAGYANFEIADPPLKLVLFENPAPRRR